MSQISIFTGAFIIIIADSLIFLKDFLLGISINAKTFIYVRAVRVFG